MKFYEHLALAASMFLLIIFAAEANIDQTEKQTELLTCELPQEYTDGSPITEGTVIEITFYANSEKIDSVDARAGDNRTCDYIYNISGLPDGDYNLNATATLDGVVSELSNSIMRTYEVKKQTNPPTIGVQ